MSPLGNFLPPSQSLGRQKLPWEDDQGGITAEQLQKITSGQSHYDPASAAHAPVPPSIQATPAQRGAAFAPSPGELGGGMPFSARIGLGTGGFGGGQGFSKGAPATPAGPHGGTSSVVGNMMSRGAGPGPDYGAGGYSGATPEPSPSVSLGYRGTQNMMAGTGGTSTASTRDAGWSGSPAGNVEAAKGAIAEGKAAMAKGDYDVAFAAFDAANKMAGGSLREIGGFEPGGGTAREIGPAEVAGPEREWGRGG
jgi:hypothetical protein